MRDSDVEVWLVKAGAARNKGQSPCATTSVRVQTFNEAEKNGDPLAWSNQTMHPIFSYCTLILSVLPALRRCWAIVKSMSECQQLQELYKYESSKVPFFGRSNDFIWEGWFYIDIDIDIDQVDGMMKWASRLLWDWCSQLEHHMAFAKNSSLQLRTLFEASQQTSDMTSQNGWKVRKA